MFILQFPMCSSKRKSIPLNVDIESHPRVPTKISRYKWLSYLWDEFTFIGTFFVIYLKYYFWSFSQMNDPYILHLSPPKFST